MQRVFCLRSRHHSLTCFSRAANKASASLATNILLYPRHSSTATKRPTFSIASPITKTLQTSRMSSGVGVNGTMRAKRKQHPGTVTERPQKQHRAINGKDSAGENTPEVYEDEAMEIEEARTLPGLADTAEWQACVERVVRNVVSIRFCQTCSFDTDPALTSEATGFVVDAERG